MTERVCTVSKKAGGYADLHSPVFVPKSYKDFIFLANIIKTFKNTIKSYFGMMTVDFAYVIITLWYNNLTNICYNNLTKQNEIEDFCVFGEHFNITLRGGIRLALLLKKKIRRIFNYML